MKTSDKKFLTSLIAGYHIEKEHKKTVSGNKVTTARIALDHIEEDPNYYRKLAQCVEKPTAHQRGKMRRIS